MNSNYPSAFIIAATSSGSGKTTVTSALLRLLSKKGYKVAPFKCGPDYIDPIYHKIACGNRSVNLDLFMSSNQHIKMLWEKEISTNNIAICEGVMGMFDGYNRDCGSSAHLSKILDIPIILIIDCKSAAFSIAATINGFNTLDNSVKIAGVILNRVSSVNHLNILKEACDYINMPVIGYLPVSDDFSMESRHLGLDIFDSKKIDDAIERAANSMEKSIDIDLLLELTKYNKIKRDTKSNNYNLNDPLKSKQILSIAYDSAFNFIYINNIDSLKEIYQIEYFSPLNDNKIPDNTHTLYFPGGYPELFLDKLSNNKEMIKSINFHRNSGKRIIAECGGMMYLCRSIIDKSGISYPMCNIINANATLKEWKLTMGYRKLVIREKEFFGHEFHYSKLVEKPCEYNNLNRIKVYSSRDKELDCSIFNDKTLFASYIHLYWAEYPQLIDTLFEETIN